MRWVLTTVASMRLLVACSTPELLPDLTPLTPACPAGCAPPPPEGWKGLDVVASRENLFITSVDELPRFERPPCPSGFGEHLIGFTEMRGDAPTCACSPAPEAAFPCYFSLRQARTDGAACGSETLEPEVFGATGRDAPACVQVTRPTATLVHITPSEPTACTFVSRRSETIALLGRLQSCTVSPQRACTKRNDCVEMPPALSFQRTCVFREGEVECPLRNYTVRTLAYASIDDRRRCGPCTATGSRTCPREVQSGDGACGEPETKYTATTAEVCLDSPKSVIVGGPRKDDCKVVGSPTPSGTATPTVPVTFCCDT